MQSSSPSRPVQANELDSDNGCCDRGPMITTFNELTQCCDELEQRLDHTNMLVDRLWGRIMVLEEKLHWVGRAVSEEVPKGKARP